MKKAEARLPEVIPRDGKPSAVIRDIESYREIPERLEDAEDLRVLQAMREKPLKFRKLGFFAEVRFRCMRSGA